MMKALPGAAARGSPSQARVTAADELFAALDGQIIADGDARWEVRIWAVHADCGRLWLQIGFLGLQSFAGTITVAPGRAGDAVRNFIAWWRSAHHTALFQPLTVA